MVNINKHEIILVITASVDKIWGAMRAHRRKAIPIWRKLSRGQREGRGRFGNGGRLYQAKGTLWAKDIAM